MDAVLLLLAFAVVLAGALLFTNAVEWIGHRLEVGVGAVGSVLAAVGTAMPETLIANAVTQEGESTWFEGVLLLAVYAVLGIAFFAA
jgi:cation:H+ antiporter